MSILAEPRRKQKISVDPQNLTWKNDDQKFSKKLMEKMGWSEGDGLGRNRQGNADAVKLKANHSGKGLGSDKLNDYDSTWISHHDDFADLLAALNKNKEAEPEQTEEEKAVAAEKISIELKSKSIRRRIHYQKFTRAKDTSNYSDSHKQGILGYGRLKKDKAEEEVKKEEISDSQESGEDKKEGQNTVSTLSVGDYFAAKMAAIKAKREAAVNSAGVEPKTEPVEESVEETEEEKAKRKAEKKERKRLRREQREKEQLEGEIEIKKEEIEEEAEEQQPDDEEEKRRLKKEKKRLKRLHEAQQKEESAENDGEEELPKKRKKLSAEDH
uniref:G-patch domain-containing protein n=1 Tax=Caenorhabditis japonica TaxID=281687 RepID=A0A8R1DRK6_CAEJA